MFGSGLSGWRGASGPLVSVFTSLRGDASGSLASGWSVRVSGAWCGPSGSLVSGFLPLWRDSSGFLMGLGVSPSGSSGLFSGWSVFVSVLRFRALAGSSGWLSGCISVGVSYGPIPWARPEFVSGLVSCRGFVWSSPWSRPDSLTSPAPAGVSSGPVSWTCFVPVPGLASCRTPSGLVSDLVACRGLVRFSS